MIYSSFALLKVENIEIIISGITKMIDPCINVYEDKYDSKCETVYYFVKWLS